MALFPRLKPPPSAPKIGLNPPNLIFGGVGTLWADTGGGGWSKRRRRRRSISQGVRATGSPAPLATHGDGPPKESSGCNSTSWLLSVQRWEETDRGGQETEGPSRTLMERRWSVDSGGNSPQWNSPQAHRHTGNSPQWKHQRRTRRYGHGPVNTLRTKGRRCNSTKERCHKSTVQ